MEKSLDIWSLLIIVGIAHSLFVINLLIFKKEYAKEEGKWLLALLIALLWQQTEFLSIRWPYDLGIDVFYGTRFGSWMLVGPLFFFYVKSVSGRPIVKKDYLYLLPFGVITLLLPILFTDFLSFRQVHYGMLTPFDNRPDEISAIQYFYSAVFVFQFVYLAYFLHLSGQLIRSYKLGLKDSYSSFLNGDIRWLKVVWVGMILILGFASFFLVVLFFTEIYRRSMDYLYVLPMSALVYVISYKLAGVEWAKPEIKLKYEKSGLKANEVEKYKELIYELLVKKQLFLNQELRLQDLAEEMGISNHHLSQLLNQHMNTTFFDLINKYRVGEAKELIKTHQHYTLLQIAYDSGFNNKTSFVNAFKRFEGTTPSRFMRKSA